MCLKLPKPNETLLFTRIKVTTYANDTKQISLMSNRSLVRNLFTALCGRPLAVSSRRYIVSHHSRTSSCRVLAARHSAICN